jgi:hypothetical protein
VFWKKKKKQTETLGFNKFIGEYGRALEQKETLGYAMSISEMERIGEQRVAARELEKLYKSVEINAKLMERIPHRYVISREVMEGNAAKDILADAAIRCNDYRFLFNVEVMATSIPPDDAAKVADLPLQQMLMFCIQQYDGGKYLTNDYEFIQYYHPAEGTPPRANKDKEYYVLVPIRKV